MRIMAFVGSPRKGSNVDTLIDSVIKGAKSKTDADVEKLYLYESDIKDCNGCMVCTVLKGGKDCPLQDEMAGILNRMVEADAFIFGSPNYVHSISPALTNLFCRMQPLIKMNVTRDERGKIIAADSDCLVAGTKTVAVVSQGDFSPSASALALRILDSNIKDFKMKKVGEVFSTGNLEKAQVSSKEEDLKRAFETGVVLAS
jgi:multimeric flavodoxin WrbA